MRDKTAVTPPTHLSAVGMSRLLAGVPVSSPVTLLLLSRIATSPSLLLPDRVPVLGSPTSRRALPCWAFRTEEPDEPQQYAPSPRLGHPKPGPSPEVPRDGQTRHAYSPPPRPYTPRDSDGDPAT